jgi:hypothetical protein
MPNVVGLDFLAVDGYEITGPTHATVAGVREDSRLKAIVLAIHNARAIRVFGTFLVGFIFSDTLFPETTGKT